VPDTDDAMPADVDVIDSDLDLFQLALVYRFNGGKPLPSSGNRIERGIYVGAGAGYAAGAFQRANYCRGPGGDREVTVDADAGANRERCPAAGVIGDTRDLFGGGNVLGQGFAGYGMPIGNRFWLGVEFGYVLQDEEIRSVVSTTNNPAATGFNTTINRGDELAVSGLLGWRLREDTMLYAGGGWTRGNFETLSGATAHPDPNTQPTHSDETLTGYTIRLGAHTALSRNMFSRIEYATLPLRILKVYVIFLSHDKIF